MRSRSMWASLTLFLAVVTLPSLTSAQMQDEVAQPSDPSDSIDPSERVVQYDLAGPRLGATFMPDGTVRSQFGWHFENQASSGRNGPAFIVEKVFLVAGMEDNAFRPSGTLVFGMRLPGSFEFGVGPSVTLGGYRGMNTGIVVAAGQSFRVGGIRIPVNVAVAGQRRGGHRWTLVTGWAIRDPLPRVVSEPREPRPEGPTWEI